MTDREMQRKEEIEEEYNRLQKKKKRREKIIFLIALTIVAGSIGIGTINGVGILLTMTSAVAPLLIAIPLGYTTAILPLGLEMDTLIKEYKQIKNKKTLEEKLLQDIDVVSKVPTPCVFLTGEQVELINEILEPGQDLAISPNGEIYIVNPEGDNIDGQEVKDAKVLKNKQKRFNKD